MERLLRLPCCWEVYCLSAKQYSADSFPPTARAIHWNFFACHFFSGQRSASVNARPQPPFSCCREALSLGPCEGLDPSCETPNESLLLLQVYMGVASVTTLMLAAVVSEREQAAQQLRHLSTIDPLIGIANYRQLIDRLQAEIERSQWTARPFALLFLDLDGFKNINDRYGHLVGNRALCRVVEVLRFSCRAIDTPARFGGDEFVVILPETDEAAAEQLSRRITDRLARDRETPLISVSLGVAVYPHRAETLEALLGAADRSLYEMKSFRNHSLPTRGRLPLKSSAPFPPLSIRSSFLKWATTAHPPLKRVTQPDNHFPACGMTNEDHATREV